MSGDILNANENVEEEDYCGFTGGFSFKKTIIIGHNTKKLIDEDAENTKIDY